MAISDFSRNPLNKRHMIEIKIAIPLFDDQELPLWILGGIPDIPHPAEALSGFRSLKRTAELKSLSYIHYEVVLENILKPMIQQE